MIVCAALNITELGRALKMPVVPMSATWRDKGHGKAALNRSLMTHRGLSIDPSLARSPAVFVARPYSVIWYGSAGSRRWLGPSF
jgi:hypothetical protein